MNQKFLKILLILVLSLINLTVSASPAVEYIFYDNDDKILYVFGGYDKPSEDVGVYFAGDKFSLVKDGDTSQLDKSNKMENPKFGIGFKAPKNYFEKVLAEPYMVSDGIEEKGQKKYYDFLSNSLKENCVFYEDFEKYYNGKTNDYTLNAGKGTSVNAYEGYSENGNEFAVLHYLDEKTGNSASYSFAVPEYQNYITLEFKIKMKSIENTDNMGTGFRIDFYDEDEVTPFSIIKYQGESTPFNFVNKGINPPLCDVVKDDEWYILRVKIDSQNKLSAAAIFNDRYKGENLSGYTDTSNDLTDSELTEDDSDVSDVELKDKSNGFNVLKYNNMWQDMKNGALYTYNIPWYQDFEGGKVKKVTLSTYGRSMGEYFIDYVALYDKDGDYKKQKLRAQSDEIESYSDPKIRLVPDKTNIICNGEVMYSVYEPVIENDIIFVEAETIADILDMDFSDNENEYIFKKGNHTFKFISDGTSYWYNEREKTLSAPLLKDEDTVYIPLCDVIKYMNTKMEFKEDENVLYINKNISVDLNKWLSDNSQYEDVLTIYTLSNS